MLFRAREEQGGSQAALDEGILAATRNAWPHVPGHVRRELFDKALESERNARASQVRGSVLRSVAKTRLQGGGLEDDGSPTSNPT